jgi:hypothetical protein
MIIYPSGDFRGGVITQTQNAVPRKLKVDEGPIRGVAHLLPALPNPGV